MRIPKSKQLAYRKGFKKTTADDWFSKYIRLRDIIDNSHGFCRCITCGKIFFWKEGDCGHFVTRNHPMTRFDEINCNAQCKRCNSNIGKKGEQYKHGKAIDHKYGEGTADKLMELGSIRGQKTHGKIALKDIAKEYRLKTKKIAERKGIEL